MSEQQKQPKPELPYLTSDSVGDGRTGEAGIALYMTLRDYFIAHAPAEPQPWFFPSMPTPRPHPVGPQWPSDLDDLERRELDAWREDMLSTKDFTAPRLVQRAQEIAAHRKALSEWDTDCAKQRFIQWPAAWADEMLKARAARMDRNSLPFIRPQTPQGLGQISPSPYPYPSES